MHKNYLAIDIGASSGRHIVGWMENGVLRTQEVYSFPNSVRRVDGHLEWDIDSLFANVKQGIREAFAKYPVIESLSIDTWAVDYVLLKNGQPLSPVWAFTRPVEVALVYSRAFTPQSFHSKYSGIIKKSSACTSRPAILSAYS